MRAYLEFGKRSFQRAMTYRAATLAGMATNFFFGLVRVMAFAAFYEGAAKPPPMPLEQAISYVWLVQVTLSIGFWGVGTSPFVEDIRTGAVSLQMLRPVDYQACWFVHDAARMAQTVLMRGVPIAALAIPFFGMRLPPTCESAGLFLLSVLLGIALGVALIQLVGAIAFWTLDVTGPSNLAALMSMFFSGQLVPLALWPDGLRAVARVLPFQGLVDVPLSLYLGRHTGGAAWAQLGQQAAWAAALLLLARFLIFRGFRRLEVQGG